MNEREYRGVRETTGGGSICVVTERSLSLLDKAFPSAARVREHPHLCKYHPHLSSVRKPNKLIGFPE